jgi:hypothetical protein
MRWRKVLSWLTVDKMALVIVLSIWWFVLRPNVRVVDAIDTFSYLAAVYSTWRAARSTVTSMRSMVVRLRLRREIPETREDGCWSVDLVGDPPEGACEHRVVGREDVGGR